jgi:hypothetical protein
MFASLPLTELPARARTLYTGCRDTPEVAALLLKYDYEPPDYEAGLDLVEDVEAKSADQLKEYGEQYRATEAAALRLAELETLYARHRKLGRARHPRGSAGYLALRLAGTIPQDDEDLLAAADTFYRSLELDPSLAQGVRGLSPTAVADGRARVEAARLAYDAQERETGEAQRATHLRDQEAVRLRAHAGELSRVATVALADAPQLRETLGLLERS